MKKEQVEIYADDSNMAVIRHPKRNYPGSLIQGDSLTILIGEVQEALEELKTGNSKEAIDVLESVLESLEDRMEIYKRAMLENGIELPFSEQS